MLRLTALILALTVAGCDDPKIPEPLSDEEIASQDADRERAVEAVRSVVASAAEPADAAEVADCESRGRFVPT